MTERICPLCGQKLAKHITLDHFFPKAIYKWRSPLLTQKEVRRLEKFICNYPANRLYTHASCNFRKGNVLYNYWNLYLPLEEKKKIKSLAKVLRKYVRYYSLLKKLDYQFQNGKCYRCHCKLKNSNYANLRRIDHKQKRCLDNSCLLCDRCNNYCGHYLNKRHGRRHAI